MRRLPSYLGLLCMIIGCATLGGQSRTPASWREINADGFFFFSLPQDLKKTSAYGIDDYAGSFVGPTMTVAFDYGMYAGGPSTVWKHQSLRLDGHSATIGAGTCEICEFKNVVELHVPIHQDGPQTVALGMSVEYKNRRDRGTALRILRSVRFPDTGH
jgi:hypothetical protein